METDFGLIKRIRRAALSTSVSGIALPLSAASCWASRCRPRSCRKPQTA